MTVWIGTSGWQYRDWREPVYDRLPQGRWLESYAARYATVESNNAFYRLPERATFAAWAARTPADFLMAVKMSRYLTHIRRLRDPDEPVQRFLDRASGLGSKLGPVLLQLPPTLAADHARLRAVLERFPPTVRVAVEFRHASWWDARTRSLLEQCGAALCLTDRRRPTSPLWRTADWTFVRFHEGRATPRPCYGERALSAWALRLRDAWGPDAEAFVYFNNDPRACAPHDAAVFAVACRRVGLEPSRTPAPREIIPIGR